jgi:hypothetical protein
MLPLHYIPRIRLHQLEGGRVLPTYPLDEAAYGSLDNSTPGVSRGRRAGHLLRETGRPPKVNSKAHVHAHHWVIGRGSAPKRGVNR